MLSYFLKFRFDPSRTDAHDMNAAGFELPADCAGEVEHIALAGAVHRLVRDIRILSRSFATRIVYIQPDFPPDTVVFAFRFMKQFLLKLKGS